MPNDISNELGSIEPLISSGSVNHALRAKGLALEDETNFLQTVCDHITSSIYRAGPYDYLFLLGADEEHIPAALEEDVTSQFDDVEIEITPVEASQAAAPEGEEAEPDPEPQAVEDEPEMEESAGVESPVEAVAQEVGEASAAPALAADADLAAGIAQETADRVTRQLLEMQEESLLPRLEAFENRLIGLETAVQEAAPASIAGEIGALQAALAQHSELLNGNLTQDRLDTLIALVSATSDGEGGSGQAQSNDRLATAVETLLQTLQESAQPDPTLLDPYFMQLQRHSGQLAEALETLSETGRDVEALQSQLASLSSMAEAAPGEGVLSTAEKIETLTAVSTGLGALMERIKSEVGGFVDSGAEVLEFREPRSDAAGPDAAADAEVEEALEADDHGGAADTDYPDPEAEEMNAQADATSISEAERELGNSLGKKLVFMSSKESRPSDDAAMQGPPSPVDGNTATHAASAPSEEELDQQVEEMLKSPRIASEGIDDDEPDTLDYDRQHG